MTMQHIVEIRSNNLLGRSLRTLIAGDTKANVMITNISTFDVHLRPVISQPMGNQLLARLAEILPKPMSEIHVKQLRAHYQQPPAMEDPATHEFEPRQG